MPPPTGASATVTVPVAPPAIVALASTGPDEPSSRNASDVRITNTSPAAALNAPAVPFAPAPKAVVIAAGSPAGSANTPGPPAALVRDRTTLSLSITGPVGEPRRSNVTVSVVSVRRSSSSTRRSSGWPTVVATIAGRAVSPPAMSSSAVRSGEEPSAASASR